MSTSLKDQALDMVNVQKYFRLMETLVPEVLSFTLCNEQGVPLWTSEESIASENCLAIALINKDDTNRKIDRNGV